MSSLFKHCGLSIASDDVIKRRRSFLDGVRKIHMRGKGTKADGKRTELPCKGENVNRLTSTEKIRN